MVYEVVTVNEGGADFRRYRTLGGLVSDFPKIADDKLRELVSLSLGHALAIDGCSVVFVLAEDAAELPF